MIKPHANDDDKNTAPMTCVMNRNICQSALVLYENYIKRFKRHSNEINIPNKQLTILLLNVDSTYGGPISKMLLPTHNWKEARKKKEIPFIRALLTKNKLYKPLSVVNKKAAKELQSIPYMTIVVVENDSIEIFKA